MRVHLTAEHALELELAHILIDAQHIILDLSQCSRIVVMLGELEQLGAIADRITGAIHDFEIGAQPAAFAAKFLSPVGRAPDGGVFQLTRDFLESFFLAVVLKETPSRS